ncbi:MAG: hypothetical protein Q27BB25_10205 [Blastomonas sp. CACIA14H2]|uniref:DUF3137 domain-containing protein n=1 Tax=Blastomonas sp. CACIA14H2 TaxID=1419876 RepID=UPI0003D0055B|nr:MAG: hypothetical protein Q27BB25_10205 [Blastomonas sp. CACIA14H2]
MPVITIADVDTLLAGELGQWLQGQAEARAEAKRKAWQRWIAGLVLGGPLLLCFAGEGFVWQALGYAGLGIIAIGFTMGGIIRQNMVSSLKREMNSALARSLGVEYSPEATFGDEFNLAYAYDLLPGYTRKTCEDCWQGELGGTRFRLYEATMIERRGSGKDRRDVTVFKGVILTLRFARDFHGVTLVERQRLRLTLFGDSQTKNGMKLDRVKMVDPRFEKTFDVYGSDPVEARYLVHPAYCERLVALEERFQGKSLKALFHKGDVVVVVDSEDLFESASLNPARDRDLLARTIEQFRALAEMMTSLNERRREGTGQA